MSHDEQDALELQIATHADIDEIFKEIKNIEYDAENEALIIRQ